MQTALVPLAAMLPPHRPAPPWAELGAPRHRARRALEPPALEEGERLELLTPESLRRLARECGDALVVLLVGDEGLLPKLDLRRARALLEREVELAAGGPAHLTPLFLYLDGLASRLRTDRLLRALVARLALLGVRSSAPHPSPPRR